MPTVESALLPVRGIRLSATATNMRYTGRDDLVLMELCPTSKGVGAFTCNRFKGAPIVVASSHLAKSEPRYLLINAGSANAGLGERGVRDAVESCRMLAQAVGQTDVEKILPFSTGVIGLPLPVEQMAAKFPLLLEELAGDLASWQRAADAILTTDTRRKVASCEVNCTSGTLRISGFAKGSGMICPDMATMLAFVVTDMVIDRESLQAFFTPLVQRTFNAICVDGDTSPNDACMLVATNCGPVVWEQLGFSEKCRCIEAFAGVMRRLSYLIVADAEGATHTVCISVENAPSKRQAFQVARCVANSPLVKTALNASDPNWGRISSAIGRSKDVSFTMDEVDFFIDGLPVFQKGQQAPDYCEASVAKAMRKDYYVLRISLNCGNGRADLFTCDLSEEYIRINNSYRS